MNSEKLYYANHKHSAPKWLSHFFEKPFVNPHLPTAEYRSPATLTRNARPADMHAALRVPSPDLRSSLAKNLVYSVEYRMGPLVMTRKECVW